MNAATHIAQLLQHSN